jgi:hypothetical protein
VTFTASSKAALIGTLSLTVDSADGLAADKTFKDELDAFRARGARICELTKFAFRERPCRRWTCSRRCFHIIFIYGDCTGTIARTCSSKSLAAIAVSTNRCLASDKSVQRETNDTVGVPFALLCR